MTIVFYFAALNAARATQTKEKQELVRLLVLEHGMQKAAQLANVPYELVRQWESRRKRRALKTAQKHAQDAGVTLSQPSILPTVVERLAQAHAEHKSRSKLALGQWSAEAAEEALQSKSKLKIAKHVRDVAAVHTSLWPAEQRHEILSIGVLTGEIALRPSQEPDTGSE